MSDIKLFCPSVYWQNITENNHVSVTTSDNAVYLSFSLLHWVSRAVQMKGSQRIRLDRAIYSTTALQTTTTGKREHDGNCCSIKNCPRYLFHKAGVQHFPGGQGSRRPPGSLLVWKQDHNWVWTDVKRYFECCGPACSVLPSCQQEALSSHFCSPAAPSPSPERNTACLMQKRAGYQRQEDFSSGRTSCKGEKKD